MSFDTLMAISPIDGRYGSKTATLQPIMSEFGLIKYRTAVEIEWLLFLSQQDCIAECPSISEADQQYLRSIKDNFSAADAAAVKQHEAVTNHDVKAVEYFIQDKLKAHGDLAKLIHWVHFACTSEDINNTAYALMLHDGTHEVLLPQISKLAELLKANAQEYAQIPMMSRTHGQTATPTTVGKEFANVYARLQRQLDQLQQQIITAKFNGAVGNYNAHISAYPELDWAALNKVFVTGIGLNFNPYTTQIEPHDTVAELLQNIIRINNIVLDLCRDMWGYISLGYFKQKLVKGEVGSSTMPHKVNPIDFENAEGNLGLSTAIADHLANKLPISRWQRDLSDSTALRNLGTVYAYSLLAYQACAKGLNKCIVNEHRIAEDLDNAWELLAEPIQTILRKEKVPNAYEQLKELSRGQKITKDSLHKFIDGLQIKADVKKALKLLTPENYVGAAIELASGVAEL